MFDFAPYDTTDANLFLARGPTGIKPLYTHESELGVYFGSEIKALLTVPRILRRLDRRALADFLVLGYPLHPATFFQDVREMKPGT